MSNRSGYFNNLYHIPQNNKGLIALEKEKLTNHPNPTGYSPKTYQKINFERLLDSVFESEDFHTTLFVLYTSFHKKYR